jgi:hypothetical protein
MSATVVLAALPNRWLTTLDALGEEIGAEAVQANVPHYERLIASASAAIERYCGRIFAQQRYQELIFATKDQRLYLSRAPVVSIGSIVHDDDTLTGYRVEYAQAGVLYRADGWHLYGTDPEWTVTYVAGYRLPGQTNAMELTGPALPSDVEAAVLESIKVWDYEAEPSERITSKTLGLTGDRIDYAVSATRGALPPLAKSLLASWKRLVLV